MTQPPAGAATRVFVRRTPSLPAPTRWALALAALGTLLIGWQLYTLFPAELWRRAGAQWLDGLSHRGGWVQVGWLAGLLLPGVLWWVHRRGLRDGRLTLSPDQLQFSSGVPWLRTWIDWTLRLDELRAGRPPLRLQTPALGSHALWMIRLAWGVSGRHSVQPAAWCLQGDPSQAARTPPAQPPHRPWGFVSWHHPANAAWLQQQFEALPLLVALRQQGVDLGPLLQQRSSVEGQDLLSHPRMRVILMVLPILLVTGALLLHGSRYQHYVAPWPRAAWLACAALLMFLSLAWHWTLAPAAPAGRSQRWSLRLAQIITSALVAILVCWNLHHAPLAWARAFAPAQRMDFRLDVDQARLVSADDARPVTVIPVDLGAAYWRTQEDGSVHPLDLRQGWSQHWMQYDTEALVRRHEVRR